MTEQESQQVRHYSNDIVDRKEKSARLPLDLYEGSGLVLFTSFGYAFADRMLDFPANVDNGAAIINFVATARLLGTVLNYGYGLIDYSILRGETFSSQDFGYRALPLVYKGEGLGDDEDLGVNKYDHILYVSLPKISVEGAQNEGKLKSVKSAFLNASLYELQKKLDENEAKYSAICIDGYSIKELDDNKFEHKVKREHVLENKKVEVPMNSKGIMILTPEEFREMAMAPSELFVKAIEGTESTVIKKLIDLARSTPRDDHEKIEALLDDHLDRLLQKEVELHFNGANIKLSKEQPYYYPLKKRIERRLEIVDVHDVDYIRLISSDGSIESMPLKYAFEMEELSNEEIVEQDSQFKKGRSVYVVQELLEEFSLDELINDPYRDPKEFFERFKNQNISINVTLKSNENAEDELVDMKKTRKLKWTKFPSNVKHPAVTAAVSGGAMLLLYAGSYLSSYFPVEGNGFDPDGIPPEGANYNFNGLFGNDSQLQWKLESHGGMSKDGYYILGTTFVMNEGRWREVNVGGTEEIKVPDRPESDEYIKEEKYSRYINSPIPIKNGTELGALSVTDKKGEKIPYKLFREKDGTIHIEAEPSEAGAFHIEAYLVESKNGPRAIGKIDPIDSMKIQDKGFSYLAYSQVINGKTNLPQLIRDDYTYSLLSDINSKLNNNNLTREDVVNLILESSECNCNICNTLQVLLSTTDDDNANLNMASGYLHSVSNPESGDGNYITSKDSHAFGINEKGEIFDATPPGFDPRPTISDKEKDKLWKEQMDKFIDKKHDTWFSKQQLLLGLGAIIFGGAGIYAGRKGYKFMRRTFTKENIENFGDNIFASFYSDQELQVAHNFFNSLSWSKSGSVRITDETVEKTGIDLFNHIKGSINSSRLDDYLDDPKSYEEELYPEEKTKMRFLAKYLIGRVY